MKDGYTGVSFPFRISNRGGTLLSSTSLEKPQHIEESIEQILSTSIYERLMELDKGSRISLYLFEPNDTSSHNLIKYEIAEILNREEPRIEVKLEDINIYSKDEKIFAEIEYYIKDYGRKYIYTKEWEVE